MHHQGGAVYSRCVFKIDSVEQNGPVRHRVHMHVQSRGLLTVGKSNKFFIKFVVLDSWRNQRYMLAPVEGDPLQYLYKQWCLAAFYFYSGHFASQCQLNDAKFVHFKGYWENQRHLSGCRAVV